MIVYPGDSEDPEEKKKEYFSRLKALEATELKLEGYRVIRRNEDCKKRWSEGFIEKAFQWVTVYPGHSLVTGYAAWFQEVERHLENRAFNDDDRDLKELNRWLLKSGISIYPSLRWMFVCWPEWNAQVVKLWDNKYGDRFVVMPTEVALLHRERLLGLIEGAEKPEGR